MKKTYYAIRFDDGEIVAVISFDGSKATMLLTDGEQKDNPVAADRIISGDVSGMLHSSTEEEVDAFKAKWKVDFKDVK